jgi:glycosyltransferase involved in cell wall biosynthesis
MEYTKKLTALASATVTRQEIVLIIELVDRVLKQSEKNHVRDNILQLVKGETPTIAFKSLALYINRCSRELTYCTSAATRAPLVRSLLHLREKLAAKLSAMPIDETLALAEEQQSEKKHTLEDAIIKTYQISVGRSPVSEEIEIWKNNFNNGLPFHEFMLLMGASPEAQKNSQRHAILPGTSDGEFVQAVYELVMGRGAAAWELNVWLVKLEEGSITRNEVLAELFDSAKKFFTYQADAAPHDGLSCLIMGTGKYLTAANWEQQAQELRQKPQKQSETSYPNKFYIKSEPQMLVSVLTSLYCGGDFIEQFMDNITSQDSFDDYIELVIVDADSPENEYKTIKRYLAHHKNINYIRCNYRIGIYDAWNVAAKAAHGKYLTNANLDDMRRHDSFILQAATLENLPFVDVVYQDLYYTFDPRLSFDEIAAFNHKTSLPVITSHNMIHFNSPHNAPMWRKRLHEELGYFDTRFKSAGDYEFWMRCLAAGKKFYKINDPHVVYYQNPKGLSTRPDTRGVVEAMEIHKTYCRKLIPQDVVMPREQFICKLDSTRANWVEAHTKDRYVLAQQALRNLARHQKYTMTKESSYDQVAC